MRRLPITRIVLGSLFGDEGKGLTTDYLCRQTKLPLVVRFNSGQQATHNVKTKDGKLHPFSQFGSGTFAGAPTYWSKYCTFFPPGLLNEYNGLIKHGVKPVLYVDGMSMVTTHWDLFYNRLLEMSRGTQKHGSVGVGFGTTIERNETPYKLYVQDLAFPSVMELKLNAIKNYYAAKIAQLSGSAIINDFIHNYDLNKAKEAFVKSVKEILSFVQIVHEKEFFQNVLTDNIVFEGAQGILLDMDFGFFPHVTRSNTTSKNALEIIERNNLLKPDIYYVTRAYQNRHGAGPMTNEGNVKLKNTENEYNVTNDWQGHFRKGCLDLDLLRYAMKCDNNFSAGLTKNLVISCVDQIDGDIMFTENGKLDTIPISSPEQIGYKLGFQTEHIMISESPCSENMRKVRQNETDLMKHYKKIQFQ